MLVKFQNTPIGDIHPTWFKVKWLSWDMWRSRSIIFPSRGGSYCMDCHYRPIRLLAIVMVKCSGKIKRLEVHMTFKSYCLIQTIGLIISISKAPWLEMVKLVPVHFNTWAVRMKRNHLIVSEDLTINTAFVPRMGSIWMRKLLFSLQTLSTEETVRFSV